MPEEALSALELTSVILENISTGVIFCDRDGTIRFINRTYAQYLEVDPTSAIGMQITDLIPDSRLAVVMKTGKAEKGDRCFIGEGSRRKTLIVNRIPVRNANGEVIGAISQSLFGDPCELKELSAGIEQLQKKVTRYRERIKSAFSTRYCLADIKGQSSSIAHARDLIVKYARSDSPVLILGATGVGKELLAHALHKESHRSRGPFVSINCGAIPAELFESELFGYAPGAFTGAHREGKMGQIELADRGTLFLDEIGDMPLQAQVKLLRVLDDKCVYRVGSTLPQLVDFRLTAATNRDLRALIRDSRFREELYYRLNAMTITVPSLHERIEDITLLVRDMLKRIDKETIVFSDDAMDALMRYGWPGNIRELRNVVERAASVCRNDIIELEDLPQEVTAVPTKTVIPPPSSSLTPLGRVINDSERRLIVETLEETGWTVVKTAKALGISRATLYVKLKKYGILRKND